jgi:competence protein ComEC
MSLTLLVAAWLMGMLLGFKFNLAPLPLLLLALSALPLGILLYLAGRSVWPAVLAGVLLLGLWRVEIDDKAVPFTLADSQQVWLRGHITNDPEATTQYIKFILEVESIDQATGWQKQLGQVLVYTEPPPSLVLAREPPYFRHGDVVTLQGTWQRPEPFEEFDYPAYLASQGISGVLWSRQVEWLPGESTSNWQSWIFDLRRKLSQSIESALPVPQSGLAQALLLGMRGQIPPDVTEDFRATGTAHLLAISGQQVGTLLVLSLGTASWLLGKRRQFYLLLPLVAIWSYALISGLPAPVTRAAIMGSLYLLAVAVGRPHSTLLLLALSALLITESYLLVGSKALTQISFLLSFAAMAGIILALPYQARVSDSIRGTINANSSWWEVWLRYLLAWTAAAVIVSTAATLATLPLVAFNFSQIPLFGIPVTILALPAMPFILAASISTALAGLVHPLLGQVFGWVAWVPLSYLLGLVSASPHNTVSGEWVGPSLVWAWYLVLGVLLVLPFTTGRLRAHISTLTSFIANLGRGHPAPRPNGLILGTLGLSLVLGVSSLLLWVQVFNRPDGLLHVYFFDVGQGDSILIITPNGQQMLVDGGPDAESATGALPGPLLPLDRSLDLVALTHIDADHTRGLLAVLDRYHVGAVLVGMADPAGALYPQWQTTLKRRHLQPIQVFSGHHIVLGDGVVLEVVNPTQSLLRGTASDRNNNGLVLRLVHGEVSFLLTGDIEAEAESYLARTQSGLESTVMKVAHHGSQTSTTPEFLQRVNL